MSLQVSGHQESLSALGFFLTFLVLSQRAVSASRAASSIRRDWKLGGAPDRGSPYLGSTENTVMDHSCFKQSFVDLHIFIRFNFIGRL